MNNYELIKQKWISQHSIGLYLMISSKAFLKVLQICKAQAIQSKMKRKYDI